MRTYRARPDLPPDVELLLDAVGALMGRVERCLYAELQKGKTTAACKNDFLVRFGITARQFNAVAFNLKGKIRSIQERRPEEIKELQASIRQLEKRLDPKSKAKNRIRPGTQKYHAKQRRLDILKYKLAVREALQADGKAHLCFGSRALFHKQFHLAENQYASFADWKADWERARSDEFFVLGSHEETAGNQTCQLEWLGGDWFRFQLRLPDTLVVDTWVEPDALGKKIDPGHYAPRTHVVFDARIPHGADTLIAALELHQAISFRFKKDGKGWWVAVSTEPIKCKKISCRAIGAVGVDQNVGFLAVTDMDLHGNPIETWRIPLNTYGLSEDQTQAAICEAVKQVIAIASERRKPIAIEELDFQQKKAELEGCSKRYSRMLSSFAYRATIRCLKARAFDAGLEVLEDCARYSSVIGRSKFAKRYGMTVHQAAALVMARRVMAYSERPNPKDHGTRAELAKKRHRHVWSTWGWVLGQQRRAAAVAPRRRPAKGGAKSTTTPRSTIRSRSSSPPGPPGL